MQTRTLFSMDELAEQFRFLDAREIHRWPILPQCAFFLVMALIASGAWYYFACVPFEERMAQALAQEQQLKSKLHSQLVQVASLEAVEKARSEAQSTLTELEQRLPSKPQMPQIISEVYNAALSQDLVVDGFEPQAAIRQEGYSVVPIQLNARGSFFSVMRFLEMFAQTARVMSIEKADVTIDSGGKPGNNLLLKATVHAYQQSGGESGR